MNHTKTIVWVHGDCLSPNGPALQAYPDHPAIWVWDDELLAQWQISLKRILFMYECLLDLPVEIRRGRVAEELAAFAQTHEARAIATVESPSPLFKVICQTLREQGFAVEIHPIEPFLDYDGHLDLKRFSRYWRVAQNYVFEMTDR